MKTPKINWMTTGAGAALAAIILFSTQMIDGAINIYAILQAGLAVLLGITASDNQHAVDVFKKIFDNWRTSLIGFVGSVITILLPYLTSTVHITWNIVMNAVGLALMGLFSNDSVVTKQIQMGKRDPVTLKKAA